ncbi:helix-turn-helix transcriptional regulator [Dickeya zeae]|uniref:YafY family transcriptional regulator n=1 Tax=Dickeya zeae TaxID=204042 RepID=A0AAE6YW72_9GAMM|nr:YafY family protein [Dickeya zeae]QIZ49382.1 YafY family transcriptional regulator [Dickeya zeae]QYM92882.1 YafY family transcriptional regulator [Dickeya zeae]
MSRAQRLLTLIQLLRSHRFAVPGPQLAEKLGISLRTLYRDIATLQSQGAPIIGEAGLGYVLQPGFTLPPLMFTEEEIEALVLGSRWVVRQADPRLQESARNALMKIAAILPNALRDTLDNTTLLVAPTTLAVRDSVDLQPLRQAIRDERKVTLHYQDGQGNASTRLIWPFVLGYFEQARVLGAWCETRQAFRHFRTDRILAFTVETDIYPTSRRRLFKQWREQQGIRLSNEDY